MEEEGIIKFDLQFSHAEPPDIDLSELNKWRRILWQHQLIGQDPGRYEGYGFGNVSQRIGPYDAPPGKRSFVISGTQTGELEQLENSHYTIISAWDITRNQVIAAGTVKPSSESLTHAMIYDLDDSIRVILHVHSPEIWTSAADRGFAVTDVSVEYGTVAMADEVMRIFKQTNVSMTGIFVMGGHEDGVVAFGSTAEQAGQHLIRALNESGHPVNSQR